jgi:hypothetical protein
MAYEDRHQAEDTTCGMAYDKWKSGKPDREGAFGAFSSGWNDASLKRSDFARRGYMPGVRREAYMAGRSYYHQAQLLRAL